MTPGMGAFVHYHSHLIHLLIGLLQCTLPGAALEDHSESIESTIPSCHGCLILCLYNTTVALHNC